MFFLECINLIIYFLDMQRDFSNFKFSQFWLVLPSPPIHLKDIAVENT